MEVVKEVWLLREYKASTFMLGQNTTVPKLFVSKKHAFTSANIHACRYNNGDLAYRPVKAYLVIEETNEDTSNT